MAEGQEKQASGVCSTRKCNNIRTVQVRAAGETGSLVFVRLERSDRKKRRHVTDVLQASGLSFLPSLFLLMVFQPKFFLW